MNSRQWRQLKKLMYGLSGLSSITFLILRFTQPDHIVRAIALVMVVCAIAARIFEALGVRSLRIEQDQRLGGSVNRVDPPG